jgi:hypothetical protein
MIYKGDPGANIGNGWPIQSERVFQMWSWKQQRDGGATHDDRHRAAEGNGIEWRHASAAEQDALPF